MRHKHQKQFEKRNANGIVKQRKALLSRLKYLELGLRLQDHHCQASLFAVNLDNIGLKSSTMMPVSHGVRTTEVTNLKLQTLSYKP